MEPGCAPSTRVVGSSPRLRLAHSWQARIQLWRWGSGQSQVSGRCCGFQWGAPSSPPGATPRRLPPSLESPLRELPQDFRPRRACRWPWFGGCSAPQPGGASRRARRFASPSFPQPAIREDRSSGPAPIPSRRPTLGALPGMVLVEDTPRTAGPGASTDPQRIRARFRLVPGPDSRALGGEGPLLRLPGARSGSAIGRSEGAAWLGPSRFAGTPMLPQARISAGARLGMWPQAERARGEWR